MYKGPVVGEELLNILEIGQRLWYWKQSEQGTIGEGHGGI